MALVAQLTAMLLFIALLLLPAVLGQLQEDVIVQCYSSAADCTSNTNGQNLSALDCCNRTGGGYISHSSLAAQCGACVVVGFDQTSVHIGPSDAGNRYPFTADVLLSTPGAPDVTGLDYTISREPAMLDLADYLSSDFPGRTNGFLPERFSIRYLSQGNAVALQPTLSFDYLIAAETDPNAGDPPIPSGAVLVYRRLNITIEDIDIINVGLQVPSPFLEGSIAAAVVERQIIAYEAPFEVTVSNEQYFGPLLPDEAAVGDFDQFNFTEQHSVIFQPATVNEQRFEELLFLMPRDNIVELREVFRWRLTVNDSRVNISTDTQIVKLDNQDVFSIGFRELAVTIREGEVAPLTIKQIGDETAGVGIGGFPEIRFQPVQLRHVSGSATINSDFSLNTTVPRLTYRSNNTLNDIPFQPITSIDDNIIEEDETIRVIIVPGGDNVVQVQRDRQTATITIIDEDTGVLSLERGTYDVIENEGSVEVCAVLTGGVLSTDTEITLRARDNTARFRSDYNTRGIRPTLPAFGNRTCGIFNIMDDLIREPLFENFTVSISSIFPENSALTVDQNPSFIRIQDDDQAEVRFAMGQATFPEEGGNQSITVILGGAQLSQEQTMEVYIDDGTSNGVSLGFVTFGTGVITQNRSISFPVVDNNIALEPDKHYLLRLRGIGNIGLGNPGTMNVTVVDDDNVSVSFMQSSYSYNESHGTVSNIQVQLSNPIAQDLSVNIGGGPGSQPSSVVVSGVAVSESIRFTAGGSQPVSLSGFDFINDEFALEAVEQYDLSLISHDYTADPSRVSLGSNTTLSINDDDVVDVAFDSLMYSFFENEGTVQVSVRLSRNISQPLTVRVEGGPVDQSITFNPSQSVGSISFALSDDFIALEDPERFQLRFSQHSFPDVSKVRLGPNSDVSILDDDVVSVTFAQSSYSYFESNGTASNIMLRLNTSIARPLSVLVSGGPGDQPSSVVVSGANVSSTVTFASNSSLTAPLPSFVITNDDVALENVERYSLSISNPSVTQNVVATGSTDIDITDDDIVTVEFESSQYLYSEDEGTVDDIMFTLDKAIATDLTIGYAGGPGSQPSTVRISGADVSGSATFTAFGSRTEQGPIFSITNDSVALETDERYQIGFSGPASDSRARLGSATTVVINDDDVVDVTFGSPTYSFFENEGTAQVSVRLSRNISQPLTVRVEGGPVNQSITFNPSQRFGSISFGLMDDSIALEDPERFQLRFSQHSFPDGSKVRLGPNSDVSILDDDVVSVTFAQPSYSYFESNGTVSNIMLRLNTSIARPLSVLVSGGPGDQPSSVVVSGANVSSTVTFASGGLLTAPLPSFVITNDDVALEDVERYSLSISNPSVTQNVVAAGSTDIDITNDDIVTVQFENSRYLYSEDEGTVDNIMFTLDKAIATDLTIGYAGGPGSQPSTVRISGADVSGSATFTAFGFRTEQGPIFSITDDSVALETDERYQIGFSGPASDSRARLGSATTVVIDDDDVVNVTFSQQFYSFAENVGMGSYELRLSNEILQPLTVNVLGGPGNQLPSVIISGSAVNQNITFPAGSRSISSTFRINDDQTALETTESYPLSIGSHFFPDPDSVNLGGEARVNIGDDDVVFVSFNGTVYEYDEDDGEVSDIAVMINTSIAQDLSINVAGGPINQPPTVVVSGKNISETLSFTAGGSQLVSVSPFTITDDTTALEDVEMYPLTVSGPSITEDVVIGPASMVRITDDDVVTVSFSRRVYSYVESDGSVSDIIVRLSGPISKNVPVQVLAEPTDSQTVVESGSSINQVLLFRPGDPSTMTVPFDITDDDVGLETLESYPIIFNTSFNTGINYGLNSMISIADDDDVNVMFVEGSYSYSEGDGSSSDIRVTTNRPFAQGITVGVSGGPGNQPSTVEPSGFNVSETLTLTANTAMAPSFPVGTFTIRDDSVALETVEQYSLGLSVATPYEGRVTVGNDTRISITDDDSVSVSFQNPSYTYSEDDGTVSNIVLVANTTVAQDLVVTVSGGPGNQPSTVVTSGANVSSVVTFTARGSRSEPIAPFTITDDSFALETVEMYQLSVSQPQPDPFVSIGSPTTVNINDDEVLRVTFGQGSYNVTEGDSNRMLQVMISNPIVQDFTVTVNGSSGPQPFVVNNGPSITQTITFNSRDRMVAMVPFDVGDDSVALENVESYTIGLSNPSQPGVNIASSTEIRVADNDVAMVGFERDTYSFLENAGTTMVVTVVLSNEVIRPFTVRVVGDPGPMTPGNSGTPVDQVLEFAANNNSSDNLRQIVPVTIIDDSISGEAVQTYPLNFTDVPQSITIGRFPSTNIVILDDDESVVRIIDGDKTVLESDGSSVITVVLTGANSDIVSVDVLNSTGGVVGRATFLSSQDVTAQTFNVTVNYLDDNVALEPNEIFTYTLGNIRGDARIGMPNSTTHTLVDDDRLTVQFVETMYTFNEPDGAVSIAVNISNPIAQSFSISTGRIIQTQPFVIQSGPNFSDSLVFTPTGPMTINVNGIVTDDMIALEDVEMYSVRLSNLNISSPYVTVGAPTNVRVISEDVVNVTFAPGNDFIELDQSRTELIAVSISSAIARQLDVNISSVYQPDPLVEQSGMSFDTQVSFVRNGPVIGTFNFPINADDVAFEAVEREVLSFTGSSPSAGVNLGPSTVATITDRDEVDIMFVTSSITVSENISMVTVQLMRSNPIRQNVTVRVLGGPNSNQQFVDISGTDVDRFVTFSPNGPDKQPLTFQVMDDQTGLEDVETYFLNLTSSIPTTRVNLGNPLRVNIMDNDIVGVNFAQTSYSFDEDDGTGSVQVVIDRSIARDLTVPVRGAPGTQPSTVFISGTNVNTDVTFSAGGSVQMTVSFPINDDNVALETVESYPLRFGPSSPSAGVTTGVPTDLMINDDDPFFYGFRESNRTYPENGGSGSFTFVSGPAARPVTFDFTQTDGPLTGINESLFNMVCGTGSSLTVPSSPSETSVVCFADIRDDPTALENDERSSIRAVPRSVTGAEPVNEQFTAVVIDDDVPGIFVTPPTTSVVEGGSVQVCVGSNVTSLRPIDVTLSTINGTATGPPDFVGGSAQLTIPAGSQGPECAVVRTLNDTESEGNETFLVGVTNISTRPSPNASEPQTPVSIGGSNTSTITIIDTTPESRRCELSSSTRRLTTFRNRESYIYNGSCERSLVTQRTSFGDFAVVVDSLDGSFMTTRLGVRLGREVLVVNAFNRTIIRQENLNRVRHSSTSSELRISVTDLDIQISIDDDGIDINIGEGSVLDTHTGLCGNRNGMLVYRNGTVVPDPDSNINRLLGHYTTPPSETFVRTIARRQCGLLGEDSETGDPMFTVPLYTPDLALPHTYSLCYEIHGSGDQYYNFISDGCTSVNGHYFSTDDPDDDHRDFHGVDRIRIRAVNKNQQCVDISVILGSDKLCTTSVGSNVISSYDSSGITVSVDRNTTRISVPNCADAALEMTVHCNVTPSGIAYQEFRVIRGLNLNEESHGIIGQFWNVETQVTKYNGTLRDGTVAPNAYRIDVKPRNKPQRSFIGFLEPVSWDFTPQRCLYAGNSQGGAINEVIEEDLNHSLLEGDYREYQMDSSFDTEFRYGHFESDRC